MKTNFKRLQANALLGSLEEDFLKKIEKDEVMLYGGNRNADVLRHIVDNCNEINNTIARFGANHSSD